MCMQVCKCMYMCLSILLLCVSSLLRSSTYCIPQHEPLILKNDMYNVWTIRILGHGDLMKFVIMGISAVKEKFIDSPTMCCAVCQVYLIFLECSFVIQAQDQLLALIRTSNSTKVNLSNISQLTIMGRHLLT